MFLATPLFLLLLIPWAGLVAYVLLGRRTVTPVPFVELWRGMKTAPRVQRSLQAPPRAIVMLLLAILLAIIASAGIHFQRFGSRAQLVLIVDNGATLAPPGRLAQLVNDAAGQLSVSYGRCDITLIKAVGEDVTRTEASDLADLGSSVKAFPVDTSAMLQAKIARQLQEQDAPVVVLSDRRLPFQRDRVFQIAPKSGITNVGIVDLAVRDWPMGQMMLRLRNDSPLTQASVEIRTGQMITTQTIQLPAPGGTSDYFFDLTEVGSSLEMSIDARDEFAMDNAVAVIRSGANPRIEVRGDVDPSVRRMIEVYARHRPPVDGSGWIIVTDSLFHLPNARAVAAVSSSANLQPTRGALQVDMGHPVLREISWKSLGDAAVAGTSPGEGWTPLVRAKDLVLLAIREQPFRQAWVGFSSPDFESTRDFVILWTNLLDYLGEGGAKIGYERLAPLSPGELPPQEPGIYQRPDGSHVAMNVVDVRFQENPSTLTNLPSELPVASRMNPLNLSPWLTLLAMGCVLLAGWWIRSKGPGLRLRG